MKLTLIAIFIALLSCSLMIENGASAQQATGPSILITRQGTLTELFDINGNSLGKVVGDGFKLTYSTSGKPRTASAFETRIDRLLTSPEWPTLKNDTATAVVQTDDKVLEITSSFTWDRNARELIIMRKFQNISNDTVRLQAVSNQVDPKLLFGDRDYHSLDLTSDPVITAGLKAGFYDCTMGKCPVPPPPCPRRPCPPQPAPDYFKARYSSSSKGAVLGWSEPITLAPRLEKPGGEAFIIIRITGKYLTGRS